MKTLQQHNRYSPGGDNWKARRWYTGQRAREKQAAEKYLPQRNRSDNRDGWIERYVRWLFCEATRLGGGPIAQHYLRCAKANYVEYCASDDVSARYRAWLAIRVCCPMACTTGRGNSISGVNTAFLLGRLTAPAEQLTTKNGKLFLKAVIATSVHQKNSDGASEERTSFIPVTIFGRTAEIFGQYVQKGDMVHLVGRLDSSEYTTTSGEKRLILSFIAEIVNLIPNAKAQQKTDADTRPKPQPKRQEASQPAAQRRPQPNFNEYGEPDQIPF